MFKWLKIKKGKDNQVNNVSSIISTNLIKEIKEIKEIKKRFLNQIQTLSGVTQNDFFSLYAVSVNNFENYLVTQNQTEYKDVFIAVLTDVVLALKKRQGYLLPVGADSETSFREREEWTFSIFVGALFKKVDKNDRLSVVEDIVPVKVFSWLKRNKKLFELLQDYLNGGNNIFNEIIVVSKPISEEEKEFISEALSATVDVVDEKQSLLFVESTVKNLTENKVKLPIFSDQEFWQWLRCSLENQELSINQVDSVVHGVELGLLLVIPKIIDKFYCDQLKKLAISDQAINLAQRIQLTKAIKKHESLIRTEQGSRIHFYCLNKWEHRTVISGIVIKPQDLFSNHSIQFSVNSLLSVDPLSGA